MDDRLISEEQIEIFLAAQKEADQIERDIVARIRSGAYTPEEIERLKEDLRRLENPPVA